jgi:hypothetical protein
VNVQTTKNVIKVFALTVPLAVLVTKIFTVILMIDVSLGDVVILWNVHAIIMKNVIVRTMNVSAKRFRVRICQRFV